MYTAPKPTYYLLLLPLLFASCYTVKEYESPAAEIVTASSFRSDTITDDSASLARLSWRELFTDTLLQSYIEEGLINNIDLLQAIQQIEIAGAYLEQARLRWLPTVNGSLQYSRSRLSRNSQFGELFTDALNQYQLGALVSWEADIWGRIKSARRAEAASYLQSVAAQTAVRTRLIANIASTYYDLVAVDEQRRIATETIENRINSLETTKALKDAGNVTAVAVKQTEAQIYTARAILVDLDLRARLLENTLSILLSTDPRPFARTSLEAQLLPDELSTGVPAQLLANRPDLVAAEYALINAFELTNVARADFYPSLNLTANLGLQSLMLGKFLDPASFFSTLTGGLTRPIFDGKRIRTRYVVAQLQRDQAQLDFRETFLQASREVSDALYNYTAADDKITEKQQELAAYELSIEYAEELLANGYANFLEVLRARENSLNSSLDIVNAKNNRLQAVVDLYEALGGGWR